MSKFIERDIQKIERAAAALGIKPIKIEIPNRWHFNFIGKIKKYTIVMAFDPSKRPAGGTRPERIKSFNNKKHWAAQQGYYFYAPSRYHITTEETRYALKQWMTTAGI